MTFRQGVIFRVWVIENGKEHLVASPKITKPLICD